MPVSSPQFVVLKILQVILQVSQRVTTEKSQTEVTQKVSAKVAACNTFVLQLSVLPILFKIFYELERRVCFISEEVFLLWFFEILSKSEDLIHRLKKYIPKVLLEIH